MVRALHSFSLRRIVADPSLSRGAGHRPPRRRWQVLAPQEQDCAQEPERLHPVAREGVTARLTPCALQAAGDRPPCGPVTPVLLLSMQLYGFLARRTTSGFNAVVLKRLISPNNNRPPMGLARLQRYMKVRARDAPPTPTRHLTAVIRAAGQGEQGRSRCWHDHGRHPPDWPRAALPEGRCVALH